MKHNIKVGQVVFVQAKTFGSDSYTLREFTVKHVGRDYFYLDEFKHQKISKTTLRGMGGYSVADRVFLSEEDVQQESLRQILERAVARFCSWHHLSLSQLEQIAAIAGIEYENI